MNTARQDYSDSFLVEDKRVLFIYLNFRIFQMLYQLFCWESAEEVLGTEYVLESFWVLFPVQKARFAGLAVRYLIILCCDDIGRIIAFDRVLRYAHKQVPVTDFSLIRHHFKVVPHVL